MDWFLYDNGLRHERVKDAGREFDDYTVFPIFRQDVQTSYIALELLTD